MKTEQEKIIVNSLAELETPWRPIRADWPSASAVCARRRGEAGFGGGGEGPRQRLAEHRYELERQGVLDGRFALTARGRKLARSWVWPFTLGDLKLATSRLLRCLRAGDCQRVGDLQFVPEQFIAGADWGEQVGKLQAAFLPLLADQILVSRSAAFGSAFYAAPSVERLKVVSANLIDDECTCRPELLEVYNKRVRDCRQAMLADERYFAELGERPLGIRPTDSGRSQNDFRGVSPWWTP